MSRLMYFWTLLKHHQALKSLSMCRTSCNASQIFSLHLLSREVCAFYVYADMDLILIELEDIQKALRHASGSSGLSAQPYWSLRSTRLGNRDSEAEYQCYPSDIAEDDSWKRSLLNFAMLVGSYVIGTPLKALSRAIRTFEVRYFSHRG